MGKKCPLINAIKMNILSNNRAVIPCRMDILRLHTNHSYLSLSEVNKEACRRPDPSTKCWYKLCCLPLFTVYMSDGSTDY